MPTNNLTAEVSRSLAIKAKDELARRDLATYVELVHGLPTLRHMKIWAAALEDESIPNILFVCPPGHGKTNYNSIFYTGFYIGTHPDNHVLLLSNTADQALKPALAVRNVIADSPAFKRLFPKVTPDPMNGWGQTKFYVQRQNVADKDPTMLAAGAWGPILGARANLLILDDVEDAEVARTPAQRNKLADWIEQTAFSRLVRGGRTIMSCTRWHELDLASRFINDPNWHVIHMPAIGYWGKDTPLCPEIKSYEELMTTKTRLSRGGSTLWEGMYQGNPTVPEGNIVKHAWWKYMPRAQFPLNWDMYIQSWDTAFKTGEENDYCVGLGVGLYRGNIFICEMMRDKMTFPDLLIKSRRFYEMSTTKPRLVLIEDKASGQSLIQVFKAGTGTGAGLLPVLPVKADNDPITRVTSVSGYIETGRVWLPQGGMDDPWVQVLTEEVEGFPTKAHNDITMALVHALNYLTKGDKFQPLDAGCIVHTAESSVEASLNMGWGELPGSDNLGDFLRELN